MVVFEQVPLVLEYNFRPKDIESFSELLKDPCNNIVLIVHIYRLPALTGEIILWSLLKMAPLESKIHYLALCSPSSHNQILA